MKNYHILLISIFLGTQCRPAPQCTLPDFSLASGKMLGTGFPLRVGIDLKENSKVTDKRCIVPHNVELTYDLMTLNRTILKSASTKATVSTTQTVTVELPSIESLLPGSYDMLINVNSKGETQESKMTNNSITLAVEVR